MAWEEVRTLPIYFRDMNELGARLAARKKELMAQIKADGLPHPETRTFTGHELEQGEPVEEAAA